MLVSTGLVYEFDAPADSQVDIMNKELSRINRIMFAWAHLVQRNKVFSRKSKIVYLKVIFNALFF